MEVTLLHANEAAPGNGITRLLVCVNNEVLTGTWVAEHEQYTICALSTLRQGGRNPLDCLGVLMKVCTVCIIFPPCTALLATEG